MQIINKRYIKLYVYIGILLRIIIMPFFISQNFYKQLVLSANTFTNSLPFFENLKILFNNGYSIFLSLIIYFYAAVLKIFSPLFLLSSSNLNEFLNDSSILLKIFYFKSIFLFAEIIICLLMLVIIELEENKIKFIKYYFLNPAIILCLYFVSDYRFLSIIFVIPGIILFINNKWRTSFVLLALAAAFDFKLFFLGIGWIIISSGFLREFILYTIFYIFMFLIFSFGFLDLSGLLSNLLNILNIDYLKFLGTQNYIYVLMMFLFIFLLYRFFPVNYKKKEKTILATSIFSFLLCLYLDNSSYILILNLLLIVIWIEDKNISLIYWMLSYIFSIYLIINNFNIFFQNFFTNQDLTSVKTLFILNVNLIIVLLLVVFLLISAIYLNISEKNE